MRCPNNRGPSRVLYQVSFLLLWVLHTASCQERPVTSWRSGASITTVEPTSTTGPGARIGNISHQQLTLSSSHSGVTVSLDDVTSPQTDTSLLVSPTTSSSHYDDPSGQWLDTSSASHIASAGEVDALSESGQFSVTPAVPDLSPSSSFQTTYPSFIEFEQEKPSESSSPIHTSDIYSESSVPHLLPSQTLLPEVPSPSLSSVSPQTSLEPSSSYDITPPLVTSQLITSIVISPTFQTSPTSDVMATSIVTSAPDTIRVPSILSDVNLTMSVTQEGELFSSPPSGEMWNQTSVLPPTSTEADEEGLSVGATVGISVACVLVVVSGVLVGLAILYHRHRSRKLDTTKAPRDHYTGLWDDNITLSYINNHFDFFQKDAQDEMISLDNDAYLNSLEFMVFTNTWGDGKRNTRF